MERPLDRPDQRAWVRLGPDDQVLREGALLPQREIDLRRRRPSQVVGAPVLRNAHHLRGWALPTTRPEPLPQRVGPWEVVLGERFVDHGDRDHAGVGQADVSPADQGIVPGSPARRNVTRRQWSTSSAFASCLSTFPESRINWSARGSISDT